MPKNDAELRRSPKCQLCKSVKDIGVIVFGSESLRICKACNEQPVLKGLYDYEKIRSIKEGFKLAKEHRLHLPYAINTVLKRYTLEEAVRKSRLLEKERNGKEGDAFAVGKRLPGSFHSKK